MEARNDEELDEEPVEAIERVDSIKEEVEPASPLEEEVDLIVDSHTHWLQGFGYYDGMGVAYSLGSFLFPPYVSGRTAETGLLKATFKGNEVALAFDTYMIENGQIMPVDETTRQEMLHYLQSISFDVEIDNEEIFMINYQ